MTLDILKDGSAKLTIGGESKLLPNLVDLHVAKARGQRNELMMVVKATTASDLPPVTDPSRPSIVNNLHVVEWVFPLAEKSEIPTGTPIVTDEDAKKQFEETTKVVDQVFENPGIE
jgi:hypothetical protein